MTKYLYIHIPFCRKFCPYCDFKKCIYNKENADKYISLIIEKLNRKYAKNKFETIYLGGGTPNCLDDKQLERLLRSLSKHLAKKYEFTIECNPEFVTESQAKILAKNKINRVSLGVQTLNPKLLKTLNRQNHKYMVAMAMFLLKKAKIHNISCDLIYGFKGQDNLSIKEDIDFLIANDAKHLSLYSLEIKENTPWGKIGYEIDEYQVEDHLKFIINYLNFLGFRRYEVSNWSDGKKYQSKHNVSVWKTNEWAAIGYGAHGFEKGLLYQYKGSILKWKKLNVKLSKYDLYFQVAMMGLRLKEGLDLSNKLHKATYEYFQERMDQDLLIKKTNNHIVCTNVNLLDNFLIKLSDDENE